MLVVLGGGGSFVYWEVLGSGGSSVYGGVLQRRNKMEG